MASGIYVQFKNKSIKKAYNLLTDTIKVALYDSNFSFNGDETTYSTTHELPTENGYTRGGKTITNMTVTSVGIEGRWDADDVLWTSSNFSAYYGVVYDATVGNDLICCIDFGGEQTVVSGTFKIQWNANGIIALE